MAEADKRKAVLKLFVGMFSASIKRWQVLGAHLPGLPRVKGLDLTDMCEWGQCFPRSLELFPVHAAVEAQSSLPETPVMLLELRKTSRPFCFPRSSRLI